MLKQNVLLQNVQNIACFKYCTQAQLQFPIPVGRMISIKTLRSESGNSEAEHLLLGTLSSKEWR